jgi:hypothetical protein
VTSIAWQIEPARKKIAAAGQTPAQITAAFQLVSIALKLHQPRLFSSAFTRRKAQLLRSCLVFGERKDGLDLGALEWKNSTMKLGLESRQLDSKRRLIMPAGH